MTELALTLAYIDPGTGSLVLQVIVGGAVGLLVTAKMYWARIKLFFAGRGGAKTAGEPSNTNAE